MLCVAQVETIGTTLLVCGGRGVDISVGDTQST